MRTPQQLAELREQAIALRLAGKSRREIKEILGPMSNSTLNDALQGAPPPDWTRRPNAKDDLHDQARQLRAQGVAYNEIAARLGVSKSTVSLWVRDLPRPPRLSYEENRRRSAAGARRYWENERPVREAQRAAQVAAAASCIGALSAREVLIAGAIAYWCEGTKNKPYRRLGRIVFMNSDPRLIRFFLRFLEVAGVSRDDLTLRVCIHESADVEAAQRFWGKITGVHESLFRRPTLKRHNPKTQRMNVGQDYHGCLKVEVRQSAQFYRKIEGWVSAATSAA